MSRSITVFQDYFKANQIAGSGDYAKVFIVDFQCLFTWVTISIKLASSCNQKELVLFLYLKPHR